MTSLSAFYILAGIYERNVAVRGDGNRFPALPGQCAASLRPGPQYQSPRSFGTIIRSNDDWRSDQKQVIKDTTVPPQDDRESAIVETLNPGAYTGIVRGKGNTTGVALVEVYSLQ